MANSFIMSSSSPLSLASTSTSASLQGSKPCNVLRNPNRVYVHDTTLRDGEQSPGVSLTVRQKLAIAQQLVKLRVDCIEVGYPFSSPAELEAAKLISQGVGVAPAGDAHVPVICAFARCTKADLHAAWEGVKQASKPRILTFIATSDIHLEHKLKKSREEVVRIAAEMVSYARSTLGCNDIEFGAEDAGRTDPRMLCHIFEEVIKAGATTIGIGDTVGSLLPHEFSQIVSNIKENTPGVQNAIISAHCHNDLGLATANSLAAAMAGARQLEVTVNGIGERAGNASLEEVVMAIKYRGEEQMDGIFTGIQTKHIARASKMVADYTCMQVQPHKAIVGANAFSHESGIHQDGMIKYKGTYEFISPEDIGIIRNNNLGIVLGKHSGRHALKFRLMQLGYEIQDVDLDEVFHKFKKLAVTKKEVLDTELEALLPSSTSHLKKD